MQRWHGWLLMIALLAGCTEDPHDLDSSPLLPAAELGQEHDPGSTGTLEGKVVWEGAVPEVPPFQAGPSPDGQPDMPPRGPRANPHAPRVKPSNRGVAEAVIFLRLVDLRRSRPWDHEPVRVEQEDWKLRIHQGQTVSMTGFVRRGEAFTAISKQKALHILWGEGAAFFSLPLPDPDVASTKRLHQKGRVELSSGADYRWMRGHLFVDDHPYYTRTDPDGRFVLPLVPPGVYQVVCWLPHWKVAWQERDPESSQVGRVGFCPPLEMPREVSVNAREAQSVDFVISLKSFGQ